MPRASSAVIALLAVTMATFYLDTGTSFHMVNDASKVSFIRKLENPVKISTGNGPILLEYEGTAYFKPFDGTELPFQLENTLFNPYSKVNLISYGKLTQKCKFVHKGETIEVYYKPSGKHLFTARMNEARVFPVGVQVDLTKHTDGQDPQLLALSSILNAPTTVSEVLLHRRLAHVGYSTMLRMHKENMFDGLNVTSEGLEECIQGPKCDSCMAGKMTKLPHHPSKSEPRNILHVDVCSIEHSNLSKAKSMAVALHEPTNYSFVALIKSKDEAGRFTREIISFINTQTRQRVTGVRSDNGGEYIAKSVSNWLTENGIHPELTIPYTPQQNGKAERLNRSLQEMARCVLADSKSPNWLWGEAIMMVNYIRNITLRPNKGVVPYYQFWGREPTYANLRVFGCKAYALIPKEKRKSKMNPVCEVGMMVGYPTRARGYRILLKDAAGNYVVQDKRDVVFDETQIGLDACFPRRKRGRSPSPPRRPGYVPRDLPIFAPSGDVLDGGVSTGGPEEAPPPPSPPRVRRIGPPVRGRGGNITRIPGNSALITMYDIDGEEYVCLVNEEELSDGDDDDYEYYAMENSTIVEPMTLKEALATPTSCGVVESYK